MTQHWGLQIDDPSLGGQHIVDLLLGSSHRWSIVGGMYVNNNIVSVSSHQCGAQYRQSFGSHLVFVLPRYHSRLQTTCRF